MSWYSSVPNGEARKSATASSSSIFAGSSFFLRNEKMLAGAPFHSTGSPPSAAKKGNGDWS